MSLNQMIQAKETIFHVSELLFPRMIFLICQYFLSVLIFFNCTDSAVLLFLLLQRPKYLTASDLVVSDSQTTTTTSVTYIQGVTKEDDF